MSGLSSGSKVFVVMSVLLLTAGCAWASTESLPSDIAREDYGTGSSKKLGRGISNVAFGWLDIPKGIEAVGQEQNFLAAVTWGPIYGVGQAVKRTLVGVYEVATFPVPSEPIVKPEFVLNSDR